MRDAARACHRPITVSINFPGKPRLSSRAEQLDSRLFQIGELHQYVSSFLGLVKCENARFGDTGGVSADRANSVGAECVPQFRRSCRTDIRSNFHEITDRARTRHRFGVAEGREEKLPSKRMVIVPAAEKAVR